MFKKIILELNLFIKENKLISFIWLISINFITVYIATNRIPEITIFWTEIMILGYDLAIAMLASVIFYIFQVYIPEKNKKKNLKKFFENNVFAFRFKVITSLLRIAGDSSLDKNNLELTDSLIKDKRLCSEYFNAEKMAAIMYNAMAGKYNSDLNWIFNDLSILEENIKHLWTTLALISDKNITENLNWILHITHPYSHLQRPETTTNNQANSSKEKDFETSLLILLKDYIPYLLYWKQPFSNNIDYQDPLLDPLKNL